MLEVEDVYALRRKVLVEGKSQRQVAREMGLARDTVRRYLATPVPEPRKRTRSRPVLEEVRPGPSRGVGHAGADAAVVGASVVAVGSGVAVIRAGCGVGDCRSASTVLSRSVRGLGAVRSQSLMRGGSMEERAQQRRSVFASLALPSADRAGPHGACDAS